MPSADSGRLLHPSCRHALKRGEMYDMRRSEELQEQLLEGCFWELSDPAWWDATSGFRFEPSQQVPSMQAKYGKTWNVVDIHPTVNDPDNPPDAEIRISARSKYGEFVRLADQEWTYEDAQKSEMDEGVRSELLEVLRSSGPRKSRHGPDALLMDGGGWVNSREAAGFIGITPVMQFWECAVTERVCSSSPPASRTTIPMRPARASLLNSSGRRACTRCRLFVPEDV